MPTLQERGLRVLARKLPEVAGGKILYRRGDNSVWIDATWGRMEFQVESADGVRLEHTDRDFLFAVGELILGGNLATPERGDRIQIKGGSVYEVLPLDGEKCYTTAGPDGAGNDMQSRVHGKRI